MIVQLHLPGQRGMSVQENDLMKDKTRECLNKESASTLQDLHGQKSEMCPSPSEAKVLSMSSNHFPLCLAARDLPQSLPVFCGTCTQNGIIVSQDSMPPNFVTSCTVPLALPTIDINESVIMSSVVGPPTAVPTLTELPSVQSLKLLSAASPDKDSPLSPVNYDCECHWLQCDRRFSNIDDLVNHVNDQHVKVERPDVDYQCKWTGCPRQGKGFNARYKMLIHIRTHTNEKPHRCGLCGKCFSRLENLKIHNRSHTGEKPYVCPFVGCNKAYSNSSDRFKHVRTHQEEKPYICKMPGCNKRYTDPSSLRKHVRTIGHYFRDGSVSSMLQQSSPPSPVPTASIPINSLLTISPPNGMLGNLQPQLIPLTSNMFPVSSSTTMFSPSVVNSTSPPTIFSPPFVNSASHNPLLQSPKNQGFSPQDLESGNSNPDRADGESMCCQDSPLDLSRSPLPHTEKDEAEENVQVD